MSSDSADIDAAVVALLAADPTLAALCPDGVYLSQAPPNCTRFVLVALMDEHDEPVFGGRAFEDASYVVKAVMLSSTNGDAKAAAARIDELLDDQPLTVAGYGYMAMYRDSRMPPYNDPDPGDPSLRWVHRGGNYRVQMALERADERATT